MNSNNCLPAILIFDPPSRQSSLSVYRALKQAWELIEAIEPLDDHHSDQIEATLGDLALMMKASRH